MNIPDSIDLIYPDGKISIEDSSSEFYVAPNETESAMLVDDQRLEFIKAVQNILENN